MKLHWHSILPFCFVLGGGMAIGNVHSAMSRGAIPSPMGYIFMGITFLSILAGLTLSRYYEGLPSVGYWGAFGCAAYVMVFGIIDIASTLSNPVVVPILFHEYLLPIAAALQVIKLLFEKSTGTSVRA